MNRRLLDLARELEALPREELGPRLRQAVVALSLAERFELLHRLGVYRHRDAVSGEASTPRETERLRQALPALLEEEGVRSLLDIPCGDFDWMRQVPLEADYTGADVVAALVESNQNRYGSDRRRFLVLDATRDALPRADLVLCRDLFIHLSLRDIGAALRNFVASGSRLLLTSHFSSRTENGDIVSGDFRPVNLCLPPFDLPPPRRLVVEDSELGGGAFRDRSMGLWRLEDVAQTLTGDIIR